MYQLRWTALVGLTALLGCSATNAPLVSDERPGVDENPAKDVDAGKGGKRDAGTPPKSGDDDDDDDQDEQPRAPISRQDAGEDNCGHDSLHTAIRTPDILIVLDRSGSMKPESRNANLRCDDLSDFRRRLECALAGIDCSSPRDMNTVNCGGTEERVIDRWTPSVAAIKKLTTDFASDVAFGLLTFPDASGGGQGCTPGTLQVPIGTNTGAEIARVLDNTRPGGGTPTGQALQTALEEFQKSSTADTAPPPQYVLLVTDGQPTCPSAAGGTGGANALMADKQLTLDALDALRKENIKTFVIGYDASLDPQFEAALTEFAQHGGTDRYYAVQDEASLAEAFTTISSSVIPCEAKITSTVIGPEYVHVTLDGKELKRDDPDGWRIDGNMVFIEGASCQALQMGKGHKVDIVIECMRVE